MTEKNQSAEVVVIQVRLPEGIAAQLDEMCTESSETRSVVVRRAIREAHARAFPGRFVGGR